MGGGGVVLRTYKELKVELEGICGETIELRLGSDPGRLFSAVPGWGGCLDLHLHEVFLSASSVVLSSVVDVARNPLSGVAGRVIDEFLGESLRVREENEIGERVRVRGRFFDLRRVFNKLNDRYFGGEVEVLISWARRSKGRRRSILFGSYRRVRGVGLIRIHPSLDQGFVPREFLEFVVYHEMLHSVIPVQVKRGRRVVHSREFRAREKEFEHFDWVSEWEEKNLHRFIGLEVV